MAEINVSVPTSHICRQTYDIAPIGHQVCVAVQYPHFGIPSQRRPKEEQTSKDPMSNGTISG